LKKSKKPFLNKKPIQQKPLNPLSQIISKMKIKSGTTKNRDEQKMEKMIILTQTTSKTPLK
jgi:hypothetical protein